MPKNTAKRKHTKQRKHHCQTPRRKVQRARETIAPGKDISSPAANSPDESSAAPDSPPYSPAVPDNRRNGEGLAEKVASSKQRLLELGRSWKQRADRGASLSDLAEQAGCSKSLVRNLLRPCQST